jgi:hypothetical protein
MPKGDADTMPRPRLPLILFAAALGLMAVGSGCSESRHNCNLVNCTSSTSSATTAPAASTVSSPPPLLPMPLVAVLQLRSESGYTAEATLRRGYLAQAAGQHNGALTLGTACQVNPQTDAIEPFELMVANTTTKFSASPGIEMMALAPHEASPDLRAEIDYSNGPQCITFTPEASAETGGELAFSPNEPLAPEKSTSAQGFLIAPNYYSPAHPQGDPALMRETIVAVQPQTGGEAYSVSSATGMLHSQAAPNAVAFLPGSDGGCLIHPPCPAPFNPGNLP